MFLMDLLIHNLAHEYHRQARAPVPITLLRTELRHTVNAVYSHLIIKRQNLSLKLHYTNITLAAVTMAFCKEKHL